jgi:hypothetical protein
MRGSRATVWGLGALILAALALTGCGSATDSANPNPSPTAACPEPVHGADPTTCAAFDPEDAMAQNERYRDRRELSAEQLAQSRDAVESIALALRPFTEPGTAVTETAVVAALIESGIERETIQTLVADGTDGSVVAFGIARSFGGCVFGEVSAIGLTIDAGGYILDGGCLAMTGH